MFKVQQDSKTVLYDTYGFLELFGSVIK